MWKFIRFIFTRYFWVNMALFFVLFVIGLWAYFMVLKNQTLHGETINTPLVIGYHLSEAENILKQAELEAWVVDSIYVEGKDGGMVVEQNPDSGFGVKQGRKIYLTLSSYSAPQIPVPAMQDEDKRNVMAQLKSLGFKVGDIRYEPWRGEDILIRFEIDSVEVKPGEKLNIGTKLDLVLGGGSSDNFVEIPNLIGTPLFQLEHQVANSGLSLGSVVPDDEFDAEDSIAAFVYKQIPEANGDSVNIGSGITVYLTTDDNKLPDFPIENEVP